MLGIAILGCGRVAPVHARLLAEGLVPGAVLRAVADTNPARAQYFAQTYHAAACTDLGQLLQRDDIAAVSLCTPSGMHADQACMVLRSGRHVIVEKPMALTVDDAERMVTTAHAAGRRIFVVHQNRCNPAIVALRQALLEGRFGRLCLGTIRLRWFRDQGYYSSDSWRGTWAQDGGVLANQAVHHLDILRWLMGPVRGVSTRTARSLVDIEAEDTHVGTMEFSNGALGVLEATTTLRPGPQDLEASVSMLGERGMVEVGGCAVNRILHWRFQDTQPGDADVIARCSNNPAHVYGHGHVAYYRAVVAALAGDATAAVVEGAEAKETIALLCACYESAASASTVTVPAPPLRSRLGER